MNLHIVGTFYQLLLAIENALEATDTENHIWVKDTIGKEKVIDNVVFKTYNDRNKFGIFNLYKGQIKNFYFHQENDIVNIWLAKKFKKYDSKVSINLCSDGTKPYGTFVNKKHKLSSNIKNTVEDQLFLIKNKKLPIVHFSDYYRYGSSRIIDKIFLEYPDSFNFKINKLDKKRNKILEQKKINKKTIFFIKKYLEINFEHKIVNKIVNKIVYFGQPYSNNLQIVENMIIDYLLDKYGEKNVLIKLHPKQIANDRKYQIVFENMPAEIIINNCVDCTLITGWSSCLLHEIGLNNKRIFTYKLYKDRPDSLLEQMQIEELPNIHYVKSLGEL